MTERRLMPVQVAVVKEVLVERILGEVLAREPARPLPMVREVLEAEVGIPNCDGAADDLRMRGIGYLTRVVEAELFEPAQEPLDGLADLLRQRITPAATWAAAVTSVSSEFARSEPLTKPAPADERAVTWQVPGPGGHVRHYVVAAGIAEVLADHKEPPGLGDPAALKRCWTYGFMIRCCEEALAPGYSD